MPDAPRLDAVITLSDALTSTPRPIWYSNPVYVHWPFKDPELFDGDDDQRIGAFRRCYGEIEQQMLKLAGLPTSKARGEALVPLLDRIRP